mmetsp:Transcript_6195/g.17681  ORF Transcript_6195/g.17681 Transcript_6195/m.17681 type:complete len:282 (+) Transcript_6195:1361-2206(+)
MCRERRTAAGKVAKETRQSFGLSETIASEQPPTMITPRKPLSAWVVTTRCSASASAERRERSSPVAAESWKAVDASMSELKARERSEADTLSPAMLTMYLATARMPPRRGEAGRAGLHAGERKEGERGGVRRPRAAAGEAAVHHLAHDSREDQRDAAARREQHEASGEPPPLRPEKGAHESRRVGRRERLDVRHCRGCWESGAAGSVRAGRASGGGAGCLGGGCSGGRGRSAAAAPKALRECARRLAAVAVAPADGAGGETTAKHGCSVVVDSVPPKAATR